MDKITYEDYLYEFLGMYFIILSIFTTYNTFVVAFVTFFAIYLTHLENTYNPIFAYLFYIDKKITLENFYIFTFIQIIGTTLGYITANFIKSLIK